MKKHILDFKENECIHIPTLEEAKWFMEKCGEFGLKWIRNGLSCSKENHGWVGELYEVVYYPDTMQSKEEVSWGVLSDAIHDGNIVYSLEQVDFIPRNPIRFVEALIEFQKAFNCPVNYKPTLIDKERAKLRYDLGKEELDEYIEAVMDEDIVGVLDALVDQAYILFGSVLESGLQDVFMEAFEEVHRSNMSKLDDNGKPIINGENGVYDESRPMQKVLKSKNYYSPNLKQFL